MTRIYQQKFYKILYIISITIFLLNFLIQNQIVFSFADDYGLIFKMNWLFWIGYLTLLLLIYFQFKYFHKISERFVYFTIFLLIIYLIGTPFFYEHLPRFEDTWGHSYLAQQIFRTGKVRMEIDLYESFPGAFLFYRTLFQDSPYFLMKFFPPIFYFAGMVVVYLLFKLLFSPKISFLSSTLYMFFNWTVEDNHISPQFLILFIFLLFLYITIKSLKGERSRKSLLVTTILSLVIVFSHPMSPIFLLSILVAIYLLCKKFRKVLLPLIIIHLSIFLVYNFYVGTLEGYINPLSNFFSLLYSGTSFSQVSQRLAVNSFSRNIFIGSRLAITIFSSLVGLASIILLYKRKDKLGTKFFFAWAFSMLAFSIVVGIVLKGEFYERFVLISSLPLAGLAAYFFNEFKQTGIILMILLIISPLYFVAKYGNEAFESISSEKLQADCFDRNFYSDCENKQEIVGSSLDYDLKLFGERYFSTSREETIASTIYLEKSKSEVEDMIISIENEKMLDRIYSTYSSAVFR